jgi:tripartite-type tricarboxylate transporter receptor subunit TctC
VAHKSLGVRSVDSLVALLKSRPGQLDYASARIGTPQHILMEQFKRAAKVDAMAIQYTGGAPAVQDLVAGHVPLMFEYAATIAGYVRSGTLVPLMTACAHRVAIFPDVPSAPEAGYFDVGVTTWGGILAPAGTPASVVLMLNRQINKILASPDVRAHIAFAGVELDLWTPEEFTSVREEGAAALGADRQGGGDRAAVGEAAGRADRLELKADEPDPDQIVHCRSRGSGNPDD